MAYDRDQVIAAVTDYYEWLLRLHLKPGDIKRPPIGGWPEISKRRFARLRKTDKVIDLLKHLPYVQNDQNSMPILVWSLSGCCDYTGWKFQQGVIDIGDAVGYFPSDIHTEDSSWEKLQVPHPHIVPLASHASRYGDYIMCDTEDGEFVIWDPFGDDGHLSFSNAEECFSYLKKAFLELNVFPISTKEMNELKDHNEEDRLVRRIATENGWPSDAFDWHTFAVAALAAGVVRGLGDI